MSKQKIDYILYINGTNHVLVKPRKFLWDKIVSWDRSAIIDFILTNKSNPAIKILIKGI